MPESPELYVVSLNNLSALHIGLKRLLRNDVFIRFSWMVVDEMRQRLAPAEHEFQFAIGVYFVRLVSHRGFSPAMTHFASLPSPQRFAKLLRSQDHCLDAAER